VKLLLQQFTFWQFGHVFGHFYSAFIQLQQLCLLATFVTLLFRYDDPSYGPFVLSLCDGFIGLL